MKLAFIIDPPDTLKPHKDSSIAMMREAARRGHEVHIMLRDSLLWRDGETRATARHLTLTAATSSQCWYVEAEPQQAPLRVFDAVVMRQDPPFDFEYITATWLLERAASEGARIFNDPRAIRDHNEKIAITGFPQFTAPTLVSRAANDLDAFIDELGDVILKPLDGMGGSSIFRVRHDDPNRNVIIETLTDHGQRSIMAQRYLPQISEGDKRILLIDGHPVPYCLARIPKAGESRGNLAAGGHGVARPLSARDREIAETIGPLLAARGLLLVGLDVIGEHLTEINVTSPTCFVEITQQTGCAVAALFIDALERAACRHVP
ncbi:MAG: glutathione synthase [Sterolibacterium sp.]|jgi:glutathione synthase|nr:glutathione synthase [Sterolibacterium sp.]